MNTQERDEKLKNLKIEYKGETFPADKTGIDNLIYIREFLSTILKYKSLLPDMNEEEQYELLNWFTKEERDVMNMMFEVEAYPWLRPPKNPILLKLEDLDKIIAKAKIQRFRIYREWLLTK